MTSQEQAEVRSWIAGLRDELYRQMGQFERDKVMAEDASQPCQRSRRTLRRESRGRSICHSCHARAGT